MKLLVDTDAFCKLSCIGLLENAIDVLEVNISECARLGQLTNMLKKGRLRKAFGELKCDEMFQVAARIPTLVQASDEWRDKLTSQLEIDPGEAQLFAAAAETGVLVMTGDKRALRALKDVAEFPTALAGRIVTLEAILIAICDQIGSQEVKKRAQTLIVNDGMFQNCFAPGTPEPLVGLVSYYNTLKNQTNPLVLWDPRCH